MGSQLCERVEPRRYKKDYDFTVFYQNNSSHVRGKKKAKEPVELFVLRKFDYKKDKNRDWVYQLNIPYQTKEELEEKIDWILMEIHKNTDLYNTFPQDCIIRDLENDMRQWG